MKSVVPARAMNVPRVERTDAAPAHAGERSLDPAAESSPFGLDLVTSLLLWPVLDERCFRLISRCLRADPHDDWESFRAALQHDGWIQPTATPGVFEVTAANRPTLEASLASLGGPAVLERTLVSAQARTQDPALLEDLALCAQSAEAWGVLELAWIGLSEADIELTPATLGVLRDVPTEARREHPILTWASGAAASMLATTQPARQNSLMDRLLFDSAMIHGDWETRDDTNTAVDAGTFRMLGQRRMPATGATRGLEAAWATKQEIDAFIERRTGEGRGPARNPHSVFRAFSARLALLRRDFPAAIQEAHLAKLLAEWRPVAVLADGVETLARALAFDTPLDLDAELPAGPPSQLGMFGLSGMGAVFRTISAGFNALNRLDRADVELALTRVTVHAADVAGVWSLRAALQAFHDAVWCDPSEGLNRLLAEFANRPAMTNEQDEPLGRSMLGRARILLLAKTGAMAAAHEAIEDLPPAIRAVAAARTALWTGHAGEAIRLADAGLLQTDLKPSDRSRLTIIAAAASLMQGTVVPAVQAKAIRVMEELISDQVLLPFASLPVAARRALLAVYQTEHGADDDALVDALSRFSALNDAGAASNAVRLTQRELKLLPLLATDDTIPTIARDLQVSVHTVRTQVATLRDKFGANSRSELIRQASLLGAIPTQAGDLRSA